MKVRGNLPRTFILLKTVYIPFIDKGVRLVCLSRLTKQEACKTKCGPYLQKGHQGEQLPPEQEGRPIFRHSRF